jgi:hypothetical protein
MDRFIRLLLVTILAIPAACARNAPSASAPPASADPWACAREGRPRQVGDPPPRPLDLPLRYDGVYQTTKPEMGSSARGPFPVWDYLRFYPDGVVVGRGGDQDPHAFSNFSADNERLPAGMVTMRDGRLSFSIREGNCPAVDYEGEVVDGRLHIRIHSHINGYRAERVYAFVQGGAGIPPSPDGRPD